MNCGRPQGGTNTLRPCTSDSTTQHSNLGLHHAVIIAVPVLICKREL